MKAKNTQAAKGTARNVSDPQIESSSANAAAAATDPKVVGYERYAGLKNILDGGFKAELSFPGFGQLPTVTDDADAWYGHVRAILAYGINELDFADGKYKVRPPSNLIRFYFTDLSR